MITQGTPISEIAVGDEILSFEGRFAVASILHNGPFFQVEIMKSHKLFRIWFYSDEIVHKVIEG